MKAWSGDHGMHPTLMPGILLSSIKLPGIENRGTSVQNPGVHNLDPHITDLAPTILELLGVKTPEYMDGRSLLHPRFSEKSDPQPNTVSMKLPDSSSETIPQEG
jgi:arylsulfatase A-like enzyme